MTTPISDLSCPGIAIFIDRIVTESEKGSGPFSEEVAQACLQGVPLITPPNLLKNAIALNDGLRKVIPLHYNGFRHLKSHFSVLLPKNANPADFQLTNLVQVELEPSSVDTFLCDTSSEPVKYQQFKSMFSEKAEIPRNVSVYVGGHGSILTKKTACLLDVEYHDFLQLLNKIYALSICFISSCQPHGSEPRIKGVLVRQGFTNLNVWTTAANYKFDEFFKQAAKFNPRVSPVKFQQSLGTILGHLDTGNPTNEPVVWNPLLRTPVGRPLKDPRRITLTGPQISKIQILLHRDGSQNFAIQSAVQEIHFFTLSIPFGLNFAEGLAPAFFSHAGGKGIHHIPSINAPHLKTIDDFVTMCFKAIKKGRSYAANGIHVFIIDTLKLGSGDFMNFSIRLRNEHSPVFRYDVANLALRAQCERVDFIFNMTQDIVSTRKRVKESSQPDSAGLKSLLFERIEQSTLDVMTNPRILFRFLCLVSFLSDRRAFLFVEQCIDRKWLHLTGKDLRFTCDNGIEQRKLGKTFLELILALAPKGKLESDLGTPERLKMAIAKNYTRFLKIFLALNPKFLETFKGDFDPLALAIECEQVDVVALLLNYKQSIAPALTALDEYLQKCNGLISPEMHQILLLFRDVGKLHLFVLKTAARVGANKEFFLTYIAKCKKEGKAVSLDFFDEALFRNSSDLLTMIDRNGVFPNLRKDLSTNSALRKSHEEILFRLMLLQKCKEKFQILVKHGLINIGKIFNSAIKHKKPAWIQFLLDMGWTPDASERTAINELAKTMDCNNILKQIKVDQDVQDKQL